MLVRIGGGSSGIREYLEEGRKAGRELSRDEIDTRVPLAGDLDFTDSVIQSMTNEGEKYLHITLAFKEDEVSEETLRKITLEFESFAMSASDNDEYCFYAEAHLPKQKSYVHAQTGELVERKPHIHIVIPKTNLLTGQHLNPFGMVEHQKEYIDAFQEQINQRYGLASPKDNRRTEITLQSEMISRYKGDQFKGVGADLKAEILEEVLENNICSMADFEKCLADRGELRTRNAGKVGEYKNIKLHGAAKGINLKEYVFSKEFIELPTDEKKKVLAQESSREYVSAKASSDVSEQHIQRLKEWRERRSLEVKYLNSGSKIYQTYKNSDPDQKVVILAEQQQKFYERWREQSPEYSLESRPLRSPQDAEVLRAAGQIKSDNRPGEAKTLGELKSFGSLRTLGGVKRLSEAQKFSELKHYPGRGVLVEPPLPRYSNSPIDRYTTELHDRKQMLKEQMHEIKRELDASRLLASLSHSHGLIIEKYPVVQGKDGSDRIKCGSRNLNVSDFLTQELNLPWKDASKILRTCYDQQKGKEPSQHQQPPRKQLWERYQSERPALQEQRQAAWQRQLESERKRRANLKAVYLAARGQAQSNRAASPAERKAQVSLARMERIAGEVALREKIKLERDAIKASYPTAGSAQYSQWLHQQAQKGDTLALEELRRRENQTQKEEETPKGKTLKSDGEIQSEAQAKPLPFLVMSYEVSKRGDVTYTDRAGELLRDSSDRVSVLRTDEQAVSISLKLAQQKFYKGGAETELDVGGSAEFKRLAVEAAVRDGLKVKFTDKDMEALRLKLTKERGQSQAKQPSPKQAEEVKKVVEKEKVKRSRRNREIEL